MRSNILSRRRLIAGLSVCVALFVACGSSLAQLPPKLGTPWWDRARELPLGSGVMFTDLPDRKAGAIVSQLHDLFREYSTRLGSLEPRPGAPMNVLAFARHEDYQFTLRSRFVLRPGPRGAVFFDSPFGETIAIAADYPSHRLQRDTAHEAFHQFAFAAFGTDLPPWVEEGLALHLGEGLVVKKRFVTTGVDRSVLYPVRTAIEAGRAIPFRNLRATTRRQWRTNQTLAAGPLQAAQSQLMVEFLLYADQNGDGAPDHAASFLRFLRMVNNAIPGDRAWSEVFGENGAQLEARWTEYVKAQQPPAFANGRAQIEYLAAGMLELFKHDVRPESAEDLASRLLELDFTMTAPRHGISFERRAIDFASAIIPGRHASAATPVVGFEPPKSKPAGRESIALPTIVTNHLQPTDFEVRWITSPSGAPIDYEIVNRR